MNRDQFWEIIDSAISSVSSTDEVALKVTQSLEQLEPSGIISFKQHQLDVEAESYRWDLWAVAYIINGGCSDDGFDYFRAWLVANGRDKFDKAMSNPESIGEWADGDADYEDMLYVADTAYQNKTGTQLPHNSLTNSRPSDPIGNEWDEDELETMYPALCQKYY